MMYNMILLVVGLLGLAGGGSAQIVQLGQCGSITLMQNFVLDTFATGTWYEVGKASTQNADCSSLQFTTTGGTISVSNPSVVNNFLQTSTGTATQNAAGSAQMTLTLSGNSIDFRILGTDYTNYAIAISCVDTSATQRTVNVWQLGRSVDSYGTQATLTAANNLLSAISLSVTDLQSIDHSPNACTQLPVIGDGQPVILAGQCATASISVVQNFDVANFGGTWHEISSYYSANAVGTCARADYTLVGTTVNVVNSQVLNQRLDTISGTATLIGTDGSGRLSVTLDVQGIPIVQELLILGTDYNSYAVSYSCFNLPNNQRQVTSWILSRTKQISAASQTAVNTVIASLVDLNDAYYINTDQSDNGCFYFPTHQPGVPVVFPGQCDNTIAALPSFSLAQFIGTWHEVEAYPKQQQTGTCVNHAFTTGTAANSLNLVSNQVVNQAATSGNGSVTIVSTDGSGRLSLTMTTGGQTIQFPYWILATDYDNYALVYSCENVDGDYRAVHTWKLSRAQTLSAAATTAINAAMAAVQVVDQQYFENVDQTDAGCFYFPAVDASTPVIFPGQCDTTIPVQANFDPVAYMGLWHEIESYPSTFQSGSCSNALYSLEGGVVDVYNTQVINQQLDTINGTAIIPDASEPAKLLVTFPVAGTDQTIATEYWVLATDYTSYALVYTCTNLPNNQRFVFSWKLSRTKELTAPANVAINAVTANIQVLDSRYYVQQDQTAVGCFYFPEPVDGVPVVFPGQCDNAIAAVPNFNLAQFEGTWHEVEAYPKQQQTGTCVNHAFTTGTTANSLNLVSNQVVNEAATSGSGSVTIISTDGSGRLSLTMTTAGGQTIQFPYWILATDYSSYALAYSCVNVDDDYRAVHTWKLSRAQTLSAAASMAINAAMAAVQVVDQQYFENIDQTDAGCFYYPVFEETPESIILPGSCPPVSGVGNFNPAAYLGEWFDVARYPIASQTGTCSRADYSLVDGVITIRNTMVVNETLRVQGGIARLSGTGTGLLQVTFVLENGEETVAMYYILGTDYVSYSLVYNCRNLGDGTRQVFSWKLSRTPTLTPAANIAIDNIVNSIQGLNEGYYQIQSQTDQDCFYVPELVPGESVLFRGSCDQVTGMQGFEASQYLGWWHEIERYPSDGVSGHCSSANFVQTSTNAIQVIETDVYNGVANQTTNVAVLSADGTITITRNGVASTYVVIATDYNTYSLLYSCEQVLGLASPQRRVWSAKHSKAGSLSAAAQAAMATYIEANPVLHQHLYESVNQSDSACFHYREDASEQVILRGQCDTTIPVQANFDLSQFAGTWYQIERYPYPQVSNDGTCVGARYTVNGDSVTVLNWEVLDGVLNTKEGTASVNGATLIVTLPVEGSDETVTTDLHILSTDYEDFALAYTCVNINAFERSVGAFKLSRRRQLSNAGQYAIGTYMANREELHQPHFISVSQHDDCEEPSSAFLFKSSIIVMLVCFVVQLVM